MQMKQKKTPLRLCVGCQEMHDKRSLIRIVRTPEGEIMLDLKGKQAGRGVYLCPRTECFMQAVKAKRMQKALKSELSAELIVRLQAQITEQEALATKSSVLP